MNKLLLCTRKIITMSYKKNCFSYYMYIRDIVTQNNTFEKTLLKNVKKIKKCN